MYEPISSASMVKSDKEFRDSYQKKGQDPEVWITEWEYYHVMLEDISSRISEDHSMIHMLNHLPTEYNLQLALLEKRIRDKDKPLNLEEIRAELSLHFERLNMKSTKNEENEELEEH
jgi:hypothetical protein